MAVKYKYPNESEVIIENANDYEIEALAEEVATYYQPVGIATNINTDKEYFWTIVGANLLETPVEIEIIEVEPNAANRYEGVFQTSQNVFYGFKRINSRYIPQVELRYEGISQNISIGLISDPSNQVTEVTELDDYINRTNIIPNSSIRWLYGTVVSNVGRLHSLEFTVTEPFDWFTIEAPRQQYKLSIIVDGTIVFTRTETFQPEYVEIFNLECPENTCPVKCGDRVCCYGSNGTATESFLFDESVYQS